MPKVSPISWADLIKKLREFGFEGPYQGGKHAFMVKGHLTLTIPNPHRKEIGVDLLTRILRQADIDREKWLKRK